MVNWISTESQWKVRRKSTEKCTWLKYQNSYEYLTEAFTQIHELVQYCIISTLGSRVFCVTKVTCRFISSRASVTCDEHIFRFQKNFRRYFYDPLGVGWSQIRFIGHNFAWPSHKISSVHRSLGHVMNLRSKWYSNLGSHITGLPKILVPRFWDVSKCLKMKIIRESLWVCHCHQNILLSPLRLSNYDYIIFLAVS